jgi:hypothetical protein
MAWGRLRRATDVVDRNVAAQTAAVTLEIAGLRSQRAGAGTAAGTPASAATSAASCDAAAAQTRGNGSNTSIADFNTWHYIQHNQRRQEHLATLGLDLGIP